MPLQCPLCHRPLNTSNRIASCDAGHSFDQAKEGYWNLLPAQHKKSHAPGDSREMLQSRRRFLEAGHYDPLVHALRNELGGSQTLLDLGCGEGFYARSLGAVAGIDISKDGVRMAAKRSPQATWAVGSAFRLPFMPDSFDALLNIFAPLDMLEALRVLKPGGRIVWVGPGPNHLNQLAALVYDSVKPHRATPPPELASGTSRRVAFSMQLAGPQLSDLLAMTPYYWSASADKQQAIAEHPTIQVDAEFECVSLDSSAAAASSNASS